MLAPRPKPTLIQIKKRIDHLLVSSTLTRQLTKGGVDRKIRGLPNSDNAWIELSLNKARAPSAQARKESRNKQPAVPKDTSETPPIE